MVFEHIEHLKQEYTDKFVVVDEERPELHRFSGQTGVVRTVNMNGRALVEFDGHENIGWYDIEVDYLRVVDEPTEDDGEKREKPATKAKEPSQLKKDRGKSGANAADQSAGDDASLSVDDILATARSNDDEPAEETAVAEEEPVEAEAAAADASSLSVDDILAAARSDSDDTKVEAAQPPADDAAEEEAVEEEAVQEEAVDDAVEEEATEAPAAVDASSMSVDDILAAARGKAKDAE